jgi:hypothetical protein
MAMAGRLEDCEVRLAGMRATGRQLSHPHVDEAVLSSVLVLRLWQGRAAEMVPALEELDQTPYPFAASVAVYLWRAGEHDRARLYHAHHGAPLDHANDASMIAWGHAAELALYLGEPALGAGAVERLAPYAGWNCCAGSALTLGPVDAYLAMGAAAAGDRAAAGRHADAAEALAGEWGLALFGEWFAGVRSHYAF